MMRRLFLLLAVFVAAAIAVDIALVVTDHQEAVVWGGVNVGFWPAFAVVSAFVIILGAEWAGKGWLDRPEDYYDGADDE